LLHILNCNSQTDKNFEIAVRYRGELLMVCIKQLTINKRHRLGSNEKQPLLFPLVYLILC